jgi:hypothetical protein
MPYMRVVRISYPYDLKIMAATVFEIDLQPQEQPSELSRRTVPMVCLEDVTST